MSSYKPSTDGLLHPAWTLVLFLLVLTVVIASPVETRLMGPIVSAGLFALLQWFVPRCRFRLDHYFSPVNIALSLLLVKLVIAPSLAMVAGDGNDLFVGSASRNSMEASILVDGIACAALCLGLNFAPSLGQRKSAVVLALSRTPSRTIVMVFAAIGLLGFVLAFGTPGRLLQYFTEPTAARDLLREYEGNWGGFLGVILRPFLAFALVAWWARCVDGYEQKGRMWHAALTGLAAIGITIANSTFSFNRAAFVFPVVSLVAVYSARTRRIPLWLTAAALAVIFPILFGIGAYRANMLAPETAQRETPMFNTSLSEVSDMVQAYAGGPPIQGLFLDRQGWGSHLYYGATLIASALSPVPVLGKDFRESSGSALYNGTLYGTYGFEDQIIPFSAELFLNFHAAGVLAGFFLLGLALATAEVWLATVGSSFGAFVIQYVATWCAMLSVWSLSVLSQIAIYFLGPIYLYWIAVQIRAFLRGVGQKHSNISIQRFGEAQ